MRSQPHGATESAELLISLPQKITRTACIPTEAMRKMRQAMSRLAQWVERVERGLTRSQTATFFARLMPRSWVRVPHRDFHATVREQVQRVDSKTMRNDNPANNMRELTIRRMQVRLLPVALALRNSVKGSAEKPPASGFGGKRKNCRPFTVFPG